jgi:hypothetical protein
MTHADKVKEFYREQGRTEEQERIIKLLQDVAFTKAFGRSKDFNAKRAILIALIKGENK